MGRIISTTLVTRPEQLPKVELGQTSIIFGKNLLASSEKKSEKPKKVKKGSQAPQK